MKIYFAYNSPDGSPYEYDFFDSPEKARAWCDEMNKKNIPEHKTWGWQFGYVEVEVK